MTNVVWMISRLLVRWWFAGTSVICIQKIVGYEPEIVFSVQNILVCIVCAIISIFLLEFLLEQ